MKVNNDRSLGATASRGAAITLGGQLIRIGIQLAGIVILARLLTPADYGILAMVLAIIGIGEVFRDFGLSSAAIQAKTVTAAQKNNLFWINSGIGLALAGIVCAASGVIAAFYGDPRLQLVAITMSSTFLLNGVATQFRADLNRHLRFFRLTATDIVGQVGGLAVGVGLALAGAGYWSLVGQQVAMLVIQLLLLLLVTGWFPGLPRRAADMGGFLRFGTNLVASQVLNYASRNVDSVIIGATLGANPLGLYNRAFQLMLLPLNQLNAPSTRVALPVLSRLQDNKARFAEFIDAGQTFMLNLVSAVLGFATAQALTIITVALGPQWTAAVPIFQILAIAGFFTAASNATYWVFLAKGLTKANLRYSLATRPLMILIIIAGAHWGVLGVATAYSIAAALLWPIGLWWVGRVSDAPVAMMFANGARTLFVYMLAAAVSFLATLALPVDAHLLRLVVGGAAMVAVIAGIAAVLPAYRRDVASMLSTKKYFRPNRRTALPGES